MIVITLVSALLVLTVSVGESEARRVRGMFGFHYHVPLAPENRIKVRQPRKVPAAVDCGEVRNSVQELTADRLVERMRRSTKRQRDIISRCTQN